MLATPQWRTTLGFSVVFSFAIYFLLTSPSKLPLKLGRLTSPRLRAELEHDPIPEFYTWTTVSAFPILDRATVGNTTNQDLCRYFPKDKLADIQPVLKIGHGVVGRARNSLNSTSACLDNILIFSDLQEEIDGHAVIDVIADIPMKLLEADNQTLPYRELVELQRIGKLSDRTLSGSEGWKTDKFKFLPSISRAWQMSPEKRWYVFYEGDTHIVWDTVFRLLANFDADVPLYFGSPSPGREGAWFGNGGPGYIISRGAMRKLVEYDWEKNTGEWLGSKLAEKYWADVLRDCCGDSLVGWALHEQGVSLSGLWPSFNPHPLAGIPFRSLYWCQPLLSLHKSSPQDLEQLWRWQWENHMPFRPITYSDIARKYFDFTVERRDDWDNGEWDAYEPAGDDPWQPNESANNCHNACVNAEDCFQWTYHLRRCWFVRSFRLGRAKEPHLEEDIDPKGWAMEDQRYMAGWDTAKIKKFMDDEPCREVQWIRPSTSRIF